MRTHLLLFLVVGTIAAAQSHNYRPRSPPPQYSSEPSSPEDLSFPETSSWEGPSHALSQSSIGQRALSQQSTGSRSLIGSAISAVPKLIGDIIGSLGNGGYLNSLVRLGIYGGSVLANQTGKLLLNLLETHMDHSLGQIGVRAETWPGQITGRLVRCIFLKLFGDEAGGRWAHIGQEMVDRVIEGAYQLMLLPDELVDDELIDPSGDDNAGPGPSGSGQYQVQPRPRPSETWHYLAPSRPRPSETGHYPAPSRPRPSESRPYQAPSRPRPSESGPYQAILRPGPDPYGNPEDNEPNEIQWDDALSDPSNYVPTRSKTKIYAGSMRVDPPELVLSGDRVVGIGYIPGL